MKKIIAFLFVTLFFCFSSSASFNFNDTCKSAYEKIICTRFEEGLTIINQEKKTNPQNLIPYYLENYIDFLTLFISEDASLFNKLKPNKELRISKIEDSENNSPYYNYCLAEIYLQWAFARIKFKEYITAAGEINKAYKLLKENEEKYPDFIPNLKGLGILHSLIGTIPDEYKWATKLVGITGTINQGVSELTSILNMSLKNEEYAYLKTESIFYLTFIQLNLQSNKDKALQLAKYLNTPSFSALIENNPLLCYAAASISLKTGSNDNAIQILLNRPKGEEYYPFHYLDFLLGSAKLNRLDNDAFSYFYLFLTRFKGQNYIKAAYQKLAWYFLINGNTEKYKEKILLASSLGSSTMDEDNQALSESKSNTVPNITLLKARLLFDGGYYQKALNIMIEKNPSDFCKTTKDYLEYTYRLGRIFDEWGYDTKAISYYELTIKNGSNSTYYFAANSALHLGMIYENQKNKTKAIYYYKLCSTFKNTEYKTSINQKAKAGLNRLQ